MPDTSVPLRLTELPLSDKERLHYSVSELQVYFNRIRLPQKHLDSAILSDKTLATTKQHGLAFLQALTRYHTCNVPFENLELHYSAQKSITLNIMDLYAKIVTQRRGGRCMENNTFFATVLRSIGFQVRNCGGRVSRAMSPYQDVRKNQASTYDGWNHMLNLVRLDGAWYVVDVGMGAMGPNLPYPLEDGFETTSIAPRRIRLERRTIAESYGSGPKLWCYDVCYEPSNQGENIWTPVYCFTETEFLPQDYEIMSWFTSTNPRSFFTKYITSTIMLMDEADGGEEIIGSITLFEGRIKRTLGLDRKVLRECKTEEERIVALKEFFDIDLTDVQRDSIPLELRLA
ncbi:arylamine N-acetyltransferase 1 [Ampelomyces quisqualis]|uniref:Arylamine N-acetyltransferase 1 n=1 Tax=Ampelomyces quisqualis TaxID=50730 RepID=A0A6A5QCT5_AMPQU|nr:arylamine N-acetyltransferase 1 [Ampelomyces quisqualis]